MPGKSGGVSQLGMTHSITIPGDDEYCLTGPPSVGGDLAQTSPTSSASTSSQQINGLIQRVQRVLQNSEILNPITKKLNNNIEKDRICLVTNELMLQLCKDFLVDDVVRIPFSYYKIEEQIIKLLKEAVIC